MHIAIPREIKPLEGRVGLVPEAAHELIKAGHQVSVEQGAGLSSGFTDQDYIRSGVNLLPDANAVYGEADMIIKVKEPVGPELELLQEHQLLFSFLHLAALPELTQRLCDIGLTAVGFETVIDQGNLPILAPMSNIAGRIAVQAGTHYLHQPFGGKGIMLGGLGSVPRGKVVVLGGGNAGGNAARLAAAMGAEVTVFEHNPAKLQKFHNLAPNITALYPYQRALDKVLPDADLLIGSVLVPGAKSPRLVSRAQVANMQPGSVIVDISVDQGGCIETTRPTTYKAPTYVEEGVVHFAVTNMPGAVPRTASDALSAALLPYAMRLAAREWRNDAVLADAVNVSDGEVVYPALM